MSDQRPKLKFIDMPPDWKPTAADRRIADRVGVIYPDETPKILKGLAELLEAWDTSL